MRHILIVQAGSTDVAVRERFGDYPAWFARLLANRVVITVVKPYEERLPLATRFDGVLVTGSPRSVLDAEPWMSDSGAYLLDAARGRPVLGVCFGHQLLACALGGRVERNPRGREAGTTVIELTEAGVRDPLFAGIPAVFEAQETHGDHVPVIPPGTTLLACGAFSPVQAFGAGALLRAVQFHPEMTAALSTSVAEHRRDLLDRTAPGGARGVLASIRDTPDAERVLTNWLDRFVGA